MPQLNKTGKTKLNVNIATPYYQYVYDRAERMGISMAAVLTLILDETIRQEKVLDSMQTNKN